MKKIYLTALFLIVATPSVALTGKELAETCNYEIGSYGHGACSGFIFGFTQGIITGTIAAMMASNVNGGKRLEVTEIKNFMGFCAAEDTSAKQMETIVISFLSSHPERLDETANVLVKDALVAAFPCQ